MASRGRPRQPLTVTDEEREVLQRWSRRPKSPHSIAQRARIVLLAADDLSNKDVADKVGVNPATVLKWRKRFLESRLDGLIDEPRPGAPRSITDADVEAVVVRTLEETPTDATHWSTRDLAKKVGMSPSSVGRIWQAFGLKPWLTDSFKLSADPQFVDKVRDVVGIYMNPPDHAVVLCVDEKTSIQALDRTQPSLPMRPGQVERRTDDYKRHGVTDLFAALNVATLGHGRAGRFTLAPVVVARRRYLDCFARGAHREPGGLLVIDTRVAGHGVDVSPTQIEYLRN